MRQQDIKITQPLSRGLPKTNQDSSYLVGDDGYFERGWWIGLKADANRVRFIEKELVSGEPVIIDRATKLIWPKDIADEATDGGDTKTWSDAIIWCLALDFGGFFNWRLPNIFEFLTLANLNEVSPSTYKTVFDNWNVSPTFWTASTDPSATNKAIRVTFTAGCYCGAYLKTAAYRFVPVRDG